ncbi:hypothetical protein [Sphingomonas oryzagri]
MTFLQLLSSLDELLYELMSWLVFLPITLWRILRAPLAMMRYAEAQLALEPDRQYAATLSPPIMLILTIVLSQALGLAFDGASPIVAAHHGLAGLVNDNATLLILRLFLFGIFALVLATWKVHRSQVDLDRDSLKPAFYAQCYVTAPLALAVGLTGIVLAYPDIRLQVAGLFLLVGSLLVYGVIQIRWFRAELGEPLMRACLDATIGMVGSLLIFVPLAFLFTR